MNAPISTASTSYLPRRPLALLFARETTEWPNAGERAGGLEAEEASHWGDVHARIVKLGVERAKHEREVCRWLLAAERLGVHVHAGYASLGEYADRTLGLKGRQTEERLRVGRALRELPALDAALAAGELCWSAVRELTRVATAETEGEWVEWANARRSREIEQAVAGREVGEGPGDPADPALVKHRLRFEVRAETIALFRDLQARVRGDLGGEVDDDTLLFELARRALGGPDDAGRASYQVAVVRCDACGRASIDAGGERVAVDEAVAEMAACDGQHIGSVGVGGSRVVEQGRSPHVGAAGDDRDADARGRKRAKQRIPPAIRRLVMARDGGKCVVPGCRNHVFVDAHHCDPVAEGGGHDPERILCLCGAHHRAVHAGTLCIEGRASSGFTFRHADGTPYGQPLSPQRVDVAAQAFGALRNMGFKHSEARALVDGVARDGGAAGDLAGFVRAALRRT